MSVYKRIIVCSPPNTTGGPELLHQLVNALRSINVEAYISYYPFDISFDCPEAYKKYKAPQINFIDDDGDLIVVPETATWILKKVKNADAAVWWLSVDNYFRKKHQSWLEDFKNKYKGLISQRVPLYKMRKYKHFAQSAYALDFLKKAGINGVYLSDYLGDEHLKHQIVSLERKNIVVFNPNKGQRQTEKLRRENPDIEFVPIQNMSSNEVLQLLSSAKVYVDFGQHPGKDRIPREAAMAGCCVITGRRGSAGYFNDVPIPDKYKLQDNNSLYLKQFRPLVESIFSDFSKHIADFESYRNIILEEPNVFLSQVISIFDKKL